MNYTKYNASGNDFVIFHTFLERDYSKLAIKLCNRINGIGADGLIVLIPNKQYDFKWLFYNNDGSLAEMCGNGSRACAHYAYVNKIANKKMNFLTLAGVIEAKVKKNIVKSQLTKPKILKEKFKEINLDWYFVNTGVPHLVTIVDNINKFDIEICKKMRKKYNANVNFLNIENKKLFVRTFERGVENETLACGTGMAACFYISNKLNLVKNKVKVYPKSGEKLILINKKENIFFKGAVKKIFTVEI